MKSKRFFRFGLCSLSLFLSFFLVACQPKVDLTRYVSEYEANLFYGEADGFTVRAYCVIREYPYKNDGVCADTEEIVSLLFSVPDTSVEYEIYLTADGETVGGDAQYDCVKQIFSYSRSLPVIREETPSVRIVQGETERVIPLRSVRKKTPDLARILSEIAQNRADLFSPLYTEYGFAAEIRVRIVYDGVCRYYICVIPQNGNIFSFLADENGSILAEKTDF